MKYTNKILFVFAFCALFFSCKKDFVQSKFELILIEGDNQTGNPNQLLANEIVVAVLRDGKPFFSAPVEAKPNSGSIQFANPSNILLNVGASDANGRLRISWKLGCIGAQELTIKLFSPGCSVVELGAGSCQSLQEIKVKAVAGAQSGWVKACGLDNFTFFSVGSSRFYEFGNDLFLLNNNNVFVSSNDGSDWATVNTPFGVNVNFTSGFSVDADGNWYMGMFNSGVFKSTNRGLSWVNLSQFIFFNQPRSFKIDGNTLFVSDQGNGIAKTTNDGASWEQVTIGTSVSGNFSEIVEASDGVWWIWDNDNGRFFKSTDKGINWTVKSVASNLAAFPANFLKATTDNHLLYLYQNVAKFINYNAATGTGTTKSFPVSTSVGSLNYFNSKIYLIAYDNSGSGSVYFDDGTAGTTFTKIDLGTMEIPNEFFVTKTGRFLVGSNAGLFVKSN